MNKVAGWKPGSDRARVYVHLNNDDANRAIGDEYGPDNGLERLAALDETEVLEKLDQLERVE